MAIEGEDLGAELHSMQVAGQVTLPSVAAVFAQGSRHLHNTSWREDQTFEGEYTRTYTDTGVDPEAPGVPGLEIDITAGKTMGKVYGPWVDLRNTAQQMMADTATSLLTAGKALVMIADAYAAQDSEAADEMNRLAEVNGDDLIPPTVPEAKYPGSDHDTDTYRVIGIPGTDIGIDIDVLEPEPIDPLEN